MHIALIWETRNVCRIFMHKSLGVLKRREVKNINIDLREIN